MEKKISVSSNAGCFKRIFGFFIDSLIITLITTFFTRIFIFTKGNTEAINKSAEEFSLLFGKVSIAGIKDYHIRYIAESPFYSSFVSILILSVIIAILYNFLSYVFLNSSTLGQKIFSLKVVNLKNDDKPNTLKLFIRSVLVQFPFKLIYFMIIGQFLYFINFHLYAPRDGIFNNLMIKIASISNVYTIGATVFVLFLFWYDIYFITNRLIMSDILSGTRVVEKRASEVVGNINTFTSVMDGILAYLDKFNDYLRSVLKKWIGIIKRK